MKVKASTYASMFRAYMHITFSAIMITVFLTTMIQGVLVHLQGQVVYAAIAYFLAWVALGTAVMTFLKGKEILGYVKLAS